MTKRKNNEPSPAPAPAPEAEHGVPPAVPAAEPAKPAFRLGTKQALLFDLLTRDGGASLDEMVAATGWLPHTTRAALTGLRKRDHAVEKEKVDGVTRYHISKGA